MKLTAAALAACIALAPIAAHAAPRITISTVTKDFVYVGGNIGCPKGAWGNAFAVNIENLMEDMDEASMERLLDLIQQFETQNGTRTESESEVRDYETKSDTVRTQTSGPVDDLGEELCALAGEFVN